MQVGGDAGKDRGCVRLFARLLMGTGELGMQVLARKLYDPDLFTEVVGQIRHWIETTEGDGFLELRERGQ